LGHGLPGAKELLQEWENQALGQHKFWCLLAGVWAPGRQYSSTAGTGYPSLWVEGTLGPSYWHRLPVATAAAPGMKDPSQWEVGVLGPPCQGSASRSYRNCSSYGRTKPVGSKCLGACLLPRLPGMQYSSCCQHGRTKTTGLLLLLPVEQWET
jgi:hypothetical protein